MSCGCFSNTTNNGGVDSNNHPRSIIYKNSTQYKKELKKRIANKSQRYEMYG